MEAPLLARMAAALAAGLLLAGEVPATSLAAAPLLALAIAARPLRAVLLGFVIGVSLSSNDVAPPPPPTGLQLPAIYRVEGEVLDAPPPSAWGTSALLRVDRIGATWPAPFVVRLGLAPEIGTCLGVGDRIEARVRLAAPSPARNPGAVDGRVRLARRGAVLSAWADGPGSVRILEGGRGFAAGVAALRRRTAARLDERLGSEDAGLARALVLGDRGNLAPADRRRFQTSGQGHLVAVSGLHVGILLALLLGLLALVGVRGSLRAAAGLAALALFVPLAGAPASAVRAGAGTALLLLAGRLGRRASGAAALAAVVGTILVSAPARVADASLALSAAAVTGILLLVPGLTRALVRPNPLPGVLPTRPAPVRRALALSLAAWLGTAPLIALLMGHLCWVAAPLAVVAVPFTAVLVATALAIPTGAPLGSTAASLFSLVADGLRALLDLVATSPMAAAPVVAPPPAYLVLYALALGLASWRRHPALLGLPFLLLLPLAFPASPVPPPHPRLVLLDVGHGQAALLLLPDGRAALVDAGRMGDATVGRRRIVPALWSLGVRQLALIAISHGDADHVGAVPDVLRDVRADAVVGPPCLDAATRQAVGARSATAGDTLLAGAWGALRVLAPQPDAALAGATNDDGLVLLLETRGGPRLLLPGDVQACGTRALLESWVAPGAEVLVLPHHGLPGKGLVPLVDATRPTLRLASCGRTTLPHLPPGTVATAAVGAIVVDLTPEGPRLQTPWRRESEGYDADPRMPDLPPPQSIAIVSLLLLAFAALSVRPLAWLTAAGAVGAWCLGTLAFAAFGTAGLVALLAPFVWANALGRLPPRSKDGPRTLRQVAANGLPALGGAVLALAGSPSAGLALYLGALATLGADTSATEIGTRYGGEPRSLVSGRRMRAGESGGVTLAGLLASGAGALVAPLAYLALARDLPVASAGLVALAGVTGGLVDSLLGATLQYRGRDAISGRVVERRRTSTGPTERVSGLSWLDNDAVNLVACLAGALLAAGWLAA